MKNYTKPEFFLGVVFILISLVITLFVMRVFQEYIPVLNLWNDPGDISPKGSVADAIGLKFGNENILYSLITIFLWICIFILILFTINIFKKKFAINSLKVLFDYPWKPYYSFWMFWLIGFPLIINIIFLIIDFISYLLHVYIFIHTEVPRPLIGLLAVIIWIGGINIIPIILKYFKK